MNLSALDNYTSMQLLIFSRGLLTWTFCSYLRGAHACQSETMIRGDQELWRPKHTQQAARGQPMTYG